MNQTSRKTFFAVCSVFFLGSLSSATASPTERSKAELRFVQIQAKDKFERSLIADAGVSIEAIRTGSIWGFADPESLEQVRKSGLKVLGNFPKSVARGGHDQGFDFPAEDSRFHNYSEMTDQLRKFQAANSDISRLRTIGQSLEGREIFALHVNTDPEALASGQSSKPGYAIMGAHHAREHLSVEIPLMFAEHLFANRQQPQIANLLANRDLWIIPMVNPDGAEYDIASGEYRMWRKNRRNNGGGAWGVDLNRNYGHMWGTGGSSSSPSSDTYKGPQAFSEPETKAVQSFVSSHLNIKVLLSIHTFSELILYPWGHKYDGITNNRDLRVFETMAQTMAKWNGYTPQQSSDLYIASGDTTDWAYGEHGIFAFTFELSPKSMWEGGFYPGQGVIDRVFKDNLKPLLYMFEVAGDPYRVLSESPGQWTPNLHTPALPEALFWEAHPLPNHSGAH